VAGGWYDRCVSPTVLSVAASASHSFHKVPVPTIRLVAGVGVEGDAHAGLTVKHRSRVRVDPTQPNMRQVHLIPSERLAELAAQGFVIAPGQLGENVTTTGLELHALPVRTRLRLGADAVVELSGLRNPCSQLDGFQRGLTAACLGRDDAGGLVRKAGVMAVVIEGGEVKSGDAIQVVLPPPPHRALDRV
jgi:MOSC domain-containing protein YiiM